MSVKPFGQFIKTELQFQKKYQFPGLIIKKSKLY